MKSRGFLLALLAAFVLAPASASADVIGDYDENEESDDEGEAGPSGQYTGMLFQVGGVFPVWDDLNEDLDAWGYPEFDGGFLSLGVEFFWRRDRVRTDVMVPFMLRKRASNEDYQSALSAGAIVWHFGVNVLPVSVFKLYPAVGMGYGWLDMSHKERGNNSVEQTHINPARPRALNMTAHNFVLDAGLVSEFAFPTSFRRGKNEHFNLVLRGGYLYTPIDADWRNGSFNLSGGPTFRMTGPYVVFGLGGDQAFED